MHARIYNPARNAMQSGTAKTQEWIYEFSPQSAKKRDPLMGWTGSKGTAGQVRMRFASKEEAIAYAKKQNVPYEVIETKARKRKPNIRPLGYAENFTTNRRTPWTH